ncbi:MAG: serine/threonine protein kinase, partial [Dactylosporangium sp.]|nr:serine/threonine protein kinase [Dactylosporangium sp.]
MERGRLLGGRYRLEEELGQGGMSVVWRAHDEVLDRKVAVKLLTPKRAEHATLLDRIRAEARVAACMRHPHVVNVHDYGEAPCGEGPPLPFVVMEIVEGTSLADALANGPLEWRVAVRACAEVASALAVAHARGIVHRDVTPRNVMLTATGAKLVDFGISATVGEAEVGPSGLLLGTPAYLAPERLDGGSVQPATDVYALGLLLYKALTGRLPWQGTTTTQMLAAHRYVEPAPLPPVPGLPPQVADLCRRCLAKRPGDRPTSAEVAAVLAPVCLEPDVIWPRTPIGRAVVAAPPRPATAVLAGAAARP